MFGLQEARIKVRACTAANAWGTLSCPLLLSLFGRGGGREPGMTPACFEDGWLSAFNPWHPSGFLRSDAFDPPPGGASRDRSGSVPRPPLQRLIQRLPGARDCLKFADWVVPEPEWNEPTEAEARRRKIEAARRVRLPPSVEPVRLPVHTGRQVGQGLHRAPPAAAIYCLLPPLSAAYCRRYLLPTAAAVCLHRLGGEKGVMSTQPGPPGATCATSRTRSTGTRSSPATTPPVELWSTWVVMAWRPGLPRARSGSATPAASVSPLSASSARSW